MSPETLKYLLIGVVSFGFLLEKILSYLNIQRPVPKVPETLGQYLSSEKLLEAKAYQRENYNFGLVTGIFSFALTILFIYMGWFGWIDDWIGNYISNPLFHSVAFFALIFIGSDLISLPFDYYSTFVIEEKYGFNKTSLGTFFSDKLKGYILSLIVGGGLLLVFLWLIHQMGPHFWWIFWAVAAVFMVLVNLFYTAWILPLFNKLTPLEDGELKQKIIHYAQSVSFPLENILVMDGSKRSAKANAFFSGFGKRKKVVLYDTLLEQHPPDELVAVLAHEVGHYKKKHIILGMLTSVLQVGLLLFLLSQFIFSENMSLALGGSGWSAQLNIIGFTMLFSPISMIIGIGMNWLSRKNEFEADAFAKETFEGKPLAEALKTLSVKTLSNINPHPWYVFVNYSHPPLLDRLEKLEK
ncbi:MAG TPA: peptidase M48 [Algoriphagus sp.]|jgi:STE24 endopeptidase|uniref:M48 family metallopeptidase n=2 Tax=Algoriphagus TaxID=246875 RepID=UPI000C5CEBE6|nr:MULTISPECIES: M48 family metallopeptidase [unclassified Algoriphagus]MAL15622.1 peptidase M48 [Algoriphagus sp.]HCD86167.1 peptidase M48 [Algoriphagus sp.]|tara:strand:+ start:1032 stop:2264 length:1233 start_codon:yes stop_codon:yes gene_type:complete